MLVRVRAGGGGGGAISDTTDTYCTVRNYQPGKDPTWHLSALYQAFLHT